MKRLVQFWKQQIKPREIGLYDVFCAILYVVKSGCQWRTIPSDFPNWELVYYYYRAWSDKRSPDQPSILEEILKKKVGEARERDGREPKTSMGIIDSQSVKNSESAREKGYDGGKKVSGIKRHIVVDTNGLPHALGVSKANAGGREGAIQLFEKNKENLSKVKKILADGGYGGEPFRQETNRILKAEAGIAKRSGLHTFVVIPKRWVVERSFSWIDKCRRLWRNCEAAMDSSLHMIFFMFYQNIAKKNLNSF